MREKITPVPNTNIDIFLEHKPIEPIILDPCLSSDKTDANDFSFLYKSIKSAAPVSISYSLAELSNKLGLRANNESKVKNEDELAEPMRLGINK